MTNHTDTSRSGDLVERLLGEVWQRGDEWVLELTGTIGDTHFTCRHTEPLTTPKADVPGLPSLYALFARIEALEASVTGLTHQRDFLRESLNLSDQRIAELKRTAELLNGNMQHNHDEWLAAKDRIEALEAENERLRERLAHAEYNCEDDCIYCEERRQEIARAALGEKQ